MKTAKGIGGHQSARMINDEWLTPPEVIQSLGSFDLDPCSPISRPWDTAKQHYTKLDDGLLLPWFGRVWLNPPYGKMMEDWLAKMALHLNGISLMFARTDTEAFHNHVFPVADSILFIRQRLTFYNSKGEKAEANGGAPSVLVAYGEQNVEALSESNIKGKHVLLNSVPMIFVSASPSWKNVVKISLIRLGQNATLKEIYDLVEIVAPDKVERNQHFKEKVRQVLQANFTRIRKGQYSINQEINSEAA